MTQHRPSAARWGATLTATAALVALAAPTAGAATAPRAARPAHCPADCLTLGGLTETLVSFTPPSAVAVGATLSSTDAVTDAAGTRIGTDTITGVIIAIDPATKDIYTFSQADFQLADGEIRAQGVINLNQQAAGTPTTIAAEGVGGRYRGRVGTLTWQTTTPTTSTDAFKLCF